MRVIDGTPVDKIEQKFNVFATEIKAINEHTQTDRKSIVDIQQQATNLARSLSESIEKFNKDIVQTETSLSQNITQKTNSLSESIKLVSDNLTTTQKELTSLIEKLNKGTTEITPEQLGARLALLEEWQTKIEQWKKLFFDKEYVIQSDIQLLVPLGTIVMWSGDIAKIPGGWALCNGENGTPNLRDRFIVGAGGGYHAGATGGVNEIVLNTNQMPAHSHGINDPGHVHGVGDPTHTHLWGHQGGGVRQGSGGWRNGVIMSNIATTVAGAVNTTGSYTGIWIGASGTGIWLSNNGGNQAHENRPPYYALYFIMKIK